MTRTEARMFAEELHKILKKENPYFGEEWLSAENLAERLQVSAGWVKKHAEKLPRMRVGGQWRYAYNKVIFLLNNTSFDFS